jgi:aspartyl aminopeptidase
MNKKLFDYINASPTAYHATAHTASILKNAGYKELFEGDSWKLKSGKGYFVRRNGSSLIAFRTPNIDATGFMITASHSDSPCFKIKENPELADKYYVKLSTEGYGGMIYSSWMDRPLSIAGRVTVKSEKGIEIRLVDFKEPVAIIPNVAIHMNRQVNSGYSYNAAVDMLPLFGGEKDGFMTAVASLAGVSVDDIITTDLFLYNPQKGYEWGGYVSAPRLDDLQCAFASLTAFVESADALVINSAIPVYALFDNEEVGSQTKQGAASTFLYDVLSRVATAIGKEFNPLVANSFMVSCDNAHACHPNHPEFSDRNHTVHMNDGIVIKYNANQKYTSDAVSVALFKLICEEAKAPTQYYANRADMAGGSTLGNIANTQVSLNTVDIGLAQLAMHSSFETAGKKDTKYMVRALSKFYSKALKATDGGYEFN